MLVLIISMYCEDLLKGAIIRKTHRCTYWSKVVSGYSTSSANFLTFWSVFWWFRVPWDPLGFFMESTFPNCPLSYSCSHMVPCNTCLQRLPAGTAEVLVSSHGVLLFFLTLELIQVCLKCLVNLWCHWYDSLNHLEYASFWILDMFIFLSENSLRMLRVLFSLAISRYGEQNRIEMAHNQFMPYLFHTAG